MEMPLGRIHETARLDRMVMPDHLCLYGLKSKDLPERQGYAVEDHHLKTCEETEAFKKEHGASRPRRPSSKASGSAATTTSASV